MLKKSSIISQTFNLLNVFPKPNFFSEPKILIRIIKKFATMT